MTERRQRMEKMNYDEAKNPNMVNKKVQRKQPKVRSNDFTCKHCDLKFAKVTLLTSHMKICHTKVENTELGNAFTFNSPFLNVKHFFCHCSICDKHISYKSDLKKRLKNSACNVNVISL